MATGPSLSQPGIPPGRAVSLGKRVYDVAVIGPDLGGAATAALIARRGMRVLLAPLSLPAVSREQNGWLIPAAHSLLPPMRQLSGATPAIDDLGLAQDLQRQITPASSALQLLGDKLRLTLPNDLSRRREELGRELPEAEAQQAEAELDSLELLGRTWDAFLVEPPPYPARGFFERRRLHKILPHPPELPSGLVGEVLGAVAPFAASLVGDSAPEAAARQAAALVRAPLRLWGGQAQIAELLRKKALEAGADLFPEACSSLRLDRKGVGFLLGGSEMRVGTVVLACSGEEVAKLCEGGEREEQKLAVEAHLPVARKVVLAHFVVHPDGMPLALEEAALLLGHPAGPLLISVVPARRARGETAGERLMTVARVVPAGDSDGDALLASVRSALEPVLPFFEHHIVHQSADMDPALPHPLFAPHEDAHPVGLRPVSETHERALFASAAVYPGFGIEGAFLAARGCFDQAVSLSGKRTVTAT
jgi:phytoene dehydrogenase-like protein